MGIFHRPLLSDLPATRIKYKAGDRILARVSCPLTSDQHAKIIRAVKRYAGADVRVLVVDCSQMEILWYQSSLQTIATLASRQDIELKSIDMGVANLNCSVVELLPGDRLHVMVPRITSDIHRDRVYRHLREWTGRDVEIVVQEAIR